MTINPDVGKSNQGIVSRFEDRGFGELVESVMSRNIDDGRSLGLGGAEEERGFGVFVGSELETVGIGRRVDLGSERTRGVADG